MIGRAELERRLRELPPGFTILRGERGVLAARDDVAGEVAAFGFGPNSDGPLVASDAVGRRPLWELDLGADAKLLVRRFSHGGLLRWLTGRRFRDPWRPFHELVLSEHLRAAGVATPEVIAARAQTAPVGGWYLDLVTRRVPDSIDLGHVLARARSGAFSVLGLRRALRAAGSTIRALHEAGLEHADLNPNNVLVAREGDGPAWILDLDRSRLHPELTPELRRKSLARLLRHVARRERRHGNALTRADYARFLRTYAGPEWRDEWRAVEQGAERWSTLHGLGGLLERTFGRAPDPRR